jgi:hypothetical protein
MHEGLHRRSDCEFFRACCQHANPGQAIEVFEIIGFDRQVGGAALQTRIGLPQGNLGSGPALFGVLTPIRGVLSSCLDYGDHEGAYPPVGKVVRLG